MTSLDKIRYLSVPVLLEYRTKSAYKLRVKPAMVQFRLEI